jgi:hypothetical protein
MARTEPIKLLMDVVRQGGWVSMVKGVPEYFEFIDIQTWRKSLIEKV